MTVSKIVSGIVLALFWFRMNSKTIKTLGFTIGSVFSFVLLSDGKSTEIGVKEHSKFYSDSNNNNEI